MNSSNSSQLDLFTHVAAVYAERPSSPIHNEELYQSAALLAGIPMEEVMRKEPVGEDGKTYSLIQRKMRWHQQTLKRMGILERAERGAWRLTTKGREKLTQAPPAVAMLGFSTRLGIAIWGSCKRVFGSIDEPITLCVTSPPYLLRKPRAYGNVQDEREYVDFICESLEPIAKNLVRGGNICLNISNDVFVPGLPARSLYCERLVLALADRLGLYLMDRLVWENPNKPPGPIQWASKERIQLNVGYEHIYWFSNDPLNCRADNRRVLQAHSERHLNLIRNGGEQRDGVYSDGAYVIRAGKSFANETDGKIPRNILKFSSTCADKRRLAGFAREMGLPVHGATMPLELPKFLIKYMTGTGEDELVVDPFGGWIRVGKAAEILGRRWIVSEVMREYVIGGAQGFIDFSEFQFNGELQ